MVMALIIWHHQRYGSDREGGKRKGDGSVGGAKLGGVTVEMETRVSLHPPPLPLLSLLIGHLQEAPYISRCGGRRKCHGLSQHALRLRNGRYTAR